MEISTIFINFIVIISLIILMKWLWERRHLYILSMKLQGPFTIPFIGSIVFALQFMTAENYTTTVLKNYKKYGGIYRVWILKDLFVPIFDPDDIQEAMRITHSKSMYVAKPWGEAMGKGFLAMANQTESEYIKWKTHLNRLLPSLTPNSVKLHYKQMYKTCEILVDELSKISEKGLVDIKIVLLRMTADVVVTTLFDTKMEFHNGKLDSSIEAIETMAANIYKRVVNPLYWYNPIYKFTKEYANVTKVQKYANDLAREIYERGKITHNTKDKTRYTSIDLLLQAELENKMTEQEILYDIIHLWVAGFDTTGNTAAHLVLLLAMNKHCQDKAYQEIKNFFSEHYTIEWEDIDKFTYIDMCMKEALRLLPVAPGHFRYATEDIKLKSQKLTIPQGTTVGFASFITMRDPKYWDDPLTFKPERFVPEEVAKRHPYSYIPFGGGIRKCIGTLYGKVLVKLLIINLLKNFEVHSDWKLEELPLKFDFDCRLICKHYVEVTPRYT